MGYVATIALRWGDGWIRAGEPVPAGEVGRDYAQLLYLGQIQEVPDTAEPDGAQRLPDPPVPWGPDPEPVAEPEAESEPELEADDAAKAETGETDSGTPAGGDGTPPPEPPAPAAPASYVGAKQPQLKAALDARKIDYPKGPVRNAVLVGLLEADDAAKAETPAGE